MSGMGDILKYAEEQVEMYGHIMEAKNFLKEKMEYEEKLRLEKEDRIDFLDLKKVLYYRFPSEAITNQNRERILKQIKDCFKNNEKMSQLNEKEQKYVKLLAQLYDIYPKDFHVEL